MSQELPCAPVKRALFFESLMNTEIDHNDQELSQGVLHMVSSLEELSTEVVFARVKMTIHEQFRSVQSIDEEEQLIGLEQLPGALAGGPVGLVCITLLEAYFDRVAALICHLRRLGCRAHIAVGGVMPTLTPEHVAAHLPGVSFVCRGAGEYFVPELCRLLGPDASIDTPLSPAQRASVLAMRGVIALDRAGGRLLSAVSSHGVQVESLDRVALELRHLEARHLVHGIEIATSRGCVHKCSFCTIIGQMTYQARSADNIFELLERYHQRFVEIFGDEIPAKVYRVHISDDDFACDRQRAINFFRALRRTRFRLASCQVAIGDLCLKAGKSPRPEPDNELLDAISPDAFVDVGRPVTDREYIEDYVERHWSAHLQMGVESFTDVELTRHAKGYKVAHIEAVMEAMAQRGLHLDAYFILSNVQTTAEELIAGISKVASLKLRYPIHFHVKYPVTPRIVSIVPSASYRRHLRNGRAAQLDVRRIARIEGYSEFDYPFVAGDIPADAYVDAAVSKPFFTHDGRYAASITRLGELFRARLAVEVSPSGRARGRRLVRLCDDAPRRLIFQELAKAGVVPGARLGPGGVRGAKVLTDAAVELLGQPTLWASAYRESLRPSTFALVLDEGLTSAQQADAVAFAECSLANELQIRVNAPFALTVGASTTVFRQQASNGGVRLLHASREAFEATLTEATLEASLRETQTEFGQPSGPPTDLLLRIVGQWTKAGLQRLATGLAELDAAVTGSVNLAPTLMLAVRIDGAVMKDGKPIAMLDDLTHPDRHRFDLVRPLSPAQSIAERFIRWRHRRLTG